MDRLEHGRDGGAPGLRHAGGHIAVEVHGAAPVGGIGEHLRDRADHAGRLAPDDHPRAVKASGPQPGQEFPPAPRGLGEALGGADDLAVAVAVGAGGDHDGDVLVGASPAALQVYAVDAGVGVGAPGRAVPPLLDRGERLPVEVGDGRGGDARPPGDLGDVLDPPGRDPGEVHLDHRLLDAGLAPAVALDGRRREARALELGHVDGHLARARGQAPVAMAGAVRLPLGGAPVALGADELVSLRLQQAVQRVLDGLSDQLAKIGPRALLIQCCDGFGHGQPPIRFVSRQLESYRGGPCPPLHLDAIPLSKCENIVRYLCSMPFSLCLSARVNDSICGIYAQ